MELYLFIALFLFYFLTAWLVKKPLLHKLWLAAFFIAFAVTAIAVSFLRFSNQEVMMNAVELSWYYLLYLFASLMMVLGLINLWMFRRRILQIFTADSDDDDDDE